VSPFPGPRKVDHPAVSEPVLWAVRTREGRRVECFEMKLVDSCDPTVAGFSGNEVLFPGGILPPLVLQKDRNESGKTIKCHRYQSEVVR